MLFVLFAHYFLLIIVGTVCKTALTIVGLRRDRDYCAIGFYTLSTFFMLFVLFAHYFLLIIVCTVCKTALTIVGLRRDRVLYSVTYIFCFQCNFLFHKENRQIF